MVAAIGYVSCTLQSSSKMVIWVVSCAIDTRGGAMPPGKLKIAFRFSVFSVTRSSIRGTSKDCELVESKVSVKGPTAV